MWVVRPMSFQIEMPRLSSGGDADEGSAVLASWLVEIEPERPDAELPLLLRDPQAVGAWFRREVERFQTQGMVAE